MAEAALLRGAPLAEAARAEIAAAVARLRGQGVAPALAVVVASDDPAVLKYAEAKGRTADKLGIRIAVEPFRPEAGQAALEALVGRLSADPAIHGILIELPLAPGLDGEAAIRRLAPEKDVDGLTPLNLGLIAAGHEAAAIAPATPLACIRLAESAPGVERLRGRRVAVVGRGRSVGRALIPMLINRDATVTVCHSRTPDLKAAIADCEIVFVACGVPGLLSGDTLRQGQIVVDAGITVVDGRVLGDVDAASALPKLAALTPVPGGVGPLTATLVFHNLIRAIALQRGAGKPGASS